MKKLFLAFVLLASAIGCGGPVKTDSEIQKALAANHLELMLRFYSTDRFGAGGWNDTVYAKDEADICYLATLRGRELLERTNVSCEQVAELQNKREAESNPQVAPVMHYETWRITLTSTSKGEGGELWIPSSEFNYSDFESLPATIELEVGDYDGTKPLGLILKGHQLCNTIQGEVTNSSITKIWHGTGKDSPGKDYCELWLKKD